MTITHRIVAALGVVSFWCIAQAAPPTDIAAIAPPGTVAAMSFRDVSAFSQALDRAGLGRFLDEPQVRAMFDTATKKSLEDLRTQMKGSGIEMEDLSLPHGLAGLAVFARPGEDDEVSWHLLVCADYRDGADAMATVIDGFLDSQIEKNRMEVKEEPFGDAKLWTITLSWLIREDEAAKAEEDEWAAMFREDPPFSDIRELYLGRHGGVFVLSTDADAAHDALDVLQGRQRPSLADDAEYQAALAQLPRDAHMTGAVMMSAVRERMLKPFLRDIMFMFGGEMDIDAMFRVLGLDNVQAVGVSMSADTPDAVIESTQVILVPEKRGLMRIFAGPGGPFVPPPFAGRDTDAVMRITADFTHVVPLVRAVIDTLPQDVRAQAKPAFEQAAAPLMTQLFDALGRDVYIVTNYVEPFTEESEQQVVAIPVTDEIVVGNAIQLIPLGLKATDFGGNVIYRSDDMFMPITIGLGFGYAFLGPEAAVENAMRQAGNPEAGRLSNEPKFRTAVRGLSTEGMMYTWAAVEPMIRSLIATMRAEAEFEIDPEWGWEPTGIDAIMREIGKNPPDAELFLKYYGDQVSEYVATPWGFKARLLMLRPAAR